MGKTSKGRTEEEMREMREANQLLKQWLFDHIDNPYPTGDEKKELMARSGLNRKRIDAWFKNARHRYMCSATKVVNPNYSRYPSQVTKILVDWFAESSEVNRYPSKKDEQLLLKQTKLTRIQLRRWFANARKRGLLSRIRKKQSNKRSVKAEEVSSTPKSDKAGLDQLTAALGLKLPSTGIPSSGHQNMLLWNSNQNATLAQPVTPIEANASVTFTPPAITAQAMVANYIQSAIHGVNPHGTGEVKSIQGILPAATQLIQAFPASGQSNIATNLQSLLAFQAGWVLPQ